MALTGLVIDDAQVGSLNPLPVKGRNPSTVAAQIASGQSLTGAIDLADGILARIVMPASWTAANLTFQTSNDGASFNDLHDENGNEVTVTAAASRAIRLSPADWVGVRHLKLRSGTSAGAINQAALRSLVLVTVPR